MTYRVVGELPIVVLDGQAFGRGEVLSAEEIGDLAGFLLQTGAIVPIDAVEADEPTTAAPEIENGGTL